MQGLPSVAREATHTRTARRLHTGSPRLQTPAQPVQCHSAGSMAAQTQPMCRRAVRAWHHTRRRPAIAANAAHASPEQGPGGTATTSALTETRPTASITRRTCLAGGVLAPALVAGGLSSWTLSSPPRAWANPAAAVERAMLGGDLSISRVGGLAYTGHKGTRIERSATA